MKATFSTFSSVALSCSLAFSTLAQNQPSGAANRHDPFAAAWTNDIVALLGPAALDWEKPDLVWVADALPPGAQTGPNALPGAGLARSLAATGAEPWLWTNAWPCDGALAYPLSGTLVHGSPLASGPHGHCFAAPGSGMLVFPGDTLAAYIRIGSNSAPSEVMLQWFATGHGEAGSWEHRAYWGADEIAPPAYPTANRFYAGPVPPAGQWARLAVPAEAVGLAGQIVEGMAFTLYDGAAAWDRAGRTRPDPAVTGASPAAAGATGLGPATQQSRYTPQPGPAGWWRGEGNTADQAGADAGAWQGDAGAYVGGEAGQAFSLDGSDYVLVPASQTINVGAGGSLTVECWVNPSDTNAARPIVEWNFGNGWTSYGAHLWASQPTPYGNGPGCLYASLIDTGGSSHSFATPAGLISPNTWSHVALTYSASTGYGALYVNGVNQAYQYLGSFTPQTSCQMYIGARPACSAGAALWSGGLDEVSIYNAALPGSQIYDIFQAGAAGKSVVAGLSPVYVTNYMSYQDRANTSATNGLGTQQYPYWGDFDCIVSKHTAPNQTIVLGPGTFFTSGWPNLMLQQGQTLVGDPNGTTLQLFNQAPPYCWVISPNGGQVSIQNLTIECDTNQANNLANYSVGGIDLDTDNCVVSGVTILHATGWYSWSGCPGCREVAAIQVAPGPGATNNVVEGCTIYNCAGNAINGVSLWSGGGVVRNNTITMPYTPLGIGMCINSCADGATYSGNYCAGGQIGFYNDTGWNVNVLVQGNTIIGQTGSGVQMGALYPNYYGFQGINNLTFSGNTIAPWGINDLSFGIDMGNAMDNPSIPIANVAITNNVIVFYNTFFTNYLPPNCYTLNLYTPEYLSGAPPDYFWNCYIGHNQIEGWTTTIEPHNQFQMQKFTIDQNTPYYNDGTLYLPPDGTYYYTNFIH